MKSYRLFLLLAITLFSTHNILLAQSKEMSKAKSHISELFKNGISIVLYDENGTLKFPGTTKEIMVIEDRMEFRLKKEDIIINFSDILEDTIRVIENQVTFGKITLIFKGSKSYESANELKADLIFIQNQLKKNQYSSGLILFEPIAKYYRELKEKPQISEVQRKYIVQANSFNEEKQYKKAIELYLKAIETDQTSYPAAYTNLALLSAQINKFDAAIYYMKKYLMLEPEAADARSAQDKIYEWEAKN